MGKNYWGRLFVSIGSISLFHMGGVVWADDWRPSINAYQAREAREECGLFKAVHHKTQAKLDRKVSDFNNVKTSTQEHFLLLKECQKKNGILETLSEDSQLKTAQLCAESFDLWVLEGTYLTTLEEEVSGLKEELSSLKGALSRKCVSTVVANR